MGLLARSFYRLQFVLGIYELRQISKIERGSIVIDTLRYELPPDRWFLFAYLFFPRQCRAELYNKDFCEAELCYDYYDQHGCARPYSVGTNGKDFHYALFKNRQDTGYIVSGYYKEDFRAYSVMHIGESSASEYRRAEKNGFIKPICDVWSEQEAAICMLEDRNDFEKMKIDLSSLADEAKYEEEYPGSCILYSILMKLLPRCRYSHRYLKTE